PPAEPPRLGLDAVAGVVAEAERPERAVGPEEPRAVARLQHLDGAEAGEDLGVAGRLGQDPPDRVRPGGDADERDRPPGAGHRDAVAGRRPDAVDDLAVGQPLALAGGRPGRGRRPRAERAEGDEERQPGAARAARPPAPHAAPGATGSMTPSMVV